MPWLRLWVDILDDPDLDALPEETCWAWAKLLAIAKRHDRGGELPDAKRIQLWMRRTQKKVDKWISELRGAGLIDEKDGTLMMHGWPRWQEPKDRTNAKRQADYRDRHPKPSRNGVTQSEPEPESESETETDQTRGEQTLRNKRNGVTQALRNGVPGAPAVISSDPDLPRIVKLAEELSGDVSWAIWAGQQSQLGHPAHAIEESLRVCVDSGKWDRRFAGGVLKRLAGEGYPVNEKRAAAKAQSGPTNQPGGPTPEQEARFKAEIATKPRMTRAQWEEQQRGKTA